MTGQEYRAAFDKAYDAFPRPWAELLISPSPEKFMSIGQLERLGRSEMLPVSLQNQDDTSFVFAMPRKGWRGSRIPRPERLAALAWRYLRRYTRRAKLLVIRHRWYVEYETEFDTSLPIATIGGRFGFIPRVEHATTD